MPGAHEEPRSRAARYLIVRSYYFHIRSLTPQQAARNALAIRFNKAIPGEYSFITDCTQRNYIKFKGEEFQEAIYLDFFLLR